MNNTAIFDCHGKTYDKIKNELPNWLFMEFNKGNELQIITGNSDIMKKVVGTILDENCFDWRIPINNDGMIKII
jgi:hypothetical protein